MARFKFVSDETNVDGVKLVDVDNPGHLYVIHGMKLQMDKGSGPHLKVAIRNRTVEPPRDEVVTIDKGNFNFIIEFNIEEPICECGNPAKHTRGGIHCRL